MKRNMKKMSELGNVNLGFRDLTASEIKELFELNSDDPYCALTMAFCFGVEVGRRQERKKTK